MTYEVLQALDIARAESEGLGPRRRSTLEGIWKPMLAHFGLRSSASRVTIGQVMDYVARRRSSKVKGQTIRREVAALIRALRIARRDRIIAALPFDPEDMPTIRKDPPNPKTKGKAWSPEQARAVLAALSKKAVTSGHRDILEMILLTGLRLEEAYRVTPSMIVRTLRQDIQAMLHLPADSTKARRPRTIPLPRRALDIIEARAPFARMKLNKSLKLASKNAKLAGVLTPRDLRTMYLTAAGAVDPVAAQHLAGHAELKTTSIYMKTTQDRDIAAALCALNALAVDTGTVATAENPELKNAK